MSPGRTWSYWSDLRRRSYSRGVHMTSSTTLLICCLTLLLEGSAAVQALPTMQRPFSTTPPPPAYDYSDTASWAAIPGGVDSPADLVPAGETLQPNEERPADCFFVHPTGCFSSEHWNAPADDSQANERTAMMLAGQASAFSSACRIFAPKYRQLTVPAFLSGDVPSIAAASELAYEDVRAAFRAYLAEHNGGRPFILAAGVGLAAGGCHAGRRPARAFSAVGPGQLAATRLRSL